MNVICPHCKSKLSIPDDKVPRHRDSSFKCPKCKGAVQVKASPPPTPSQPSGLAGGIEQLALGGEGGLFSRSSKPQAMVCMLPSQTRDQLTEAIKRLGFLVDFPKNPQQAFHNLEYKNYPLVVVDDAFDTDRQMIVHMNEMDMSLRRKICLVRVTPGEASGNDMAALHSSVNTVIRTRDIEQEDDLYIEDLLNAALAGHEKFYAIFNDSMKAVGKA